MAVWSSLYVMIVLRYGDLGTDSNLALLSLKVMARTGVFVRVVCALKHSISGHRRQQRMILTLQNYEQSSSYQQNDLSKEFHQGRLRTKKTESQRRSKLDKIN